MSLKLFHINYKIRKICDLNHFSIISLGDCPWHHILCDHVPVSCLKLKADLLPTFTPLWFSTLYLNQMTIFSCWMSWFEVLREKSRGHVRQLSSQWRQSVLLKLFTEMHLWITDMQSEPALISVLTSFTLLMCYRQM